MLSGRGRVRLVEAVRRRKVRSAYKLFELIGNGEGWVIQGGKPLEGGSEWSSRELFDYIGVTIWMAVYFLVPEERVILR